MTAALHLHLHYPDIALELIERVAMLRESPSPGEGLSSAPPPTPQLAIIATHTAPLRPDVAAALAALPFPVETVAVANAGWDIAPLFAILPLLRAGGHGIVGHLHTKRGDSGYAAEWRALAYAGLIHDVPQVARILAAFAADPALALVGPASLYKSVATHQFRNAETLSTLAPRLLAPAYPPADWGFFAGTLFWARTELVERMALLEPSPLFRGEGRERGLLLPYPSGEGLRVGPLHERGVRPTAPTPTPPLQERGSEEEDPHPTREERERALRDGTRAHALERLFGLAPMATSGGRIGLSTPETLDIVTAPGVPDQTAIMRTLVTEAERSGGAIDPTLAALIAARNPLLDYIRHGQDADALDPNPYFSTAWYRRIHTDVTAHALHPFHHYMHHGHIEGRSTGPLFDAAYYRAAYPDVTGDPLIHFLDTGAAEGRIAIPVAALAEDDEARPRRFYGRFDIPRETAFLRQIAALPPATVARAAATRVSVVMPVHDRAGTVAAAIRSVLAQSHAALELIIVDDGSTDDLATALAPFAADPRVTLLHQPRAGVSAARNRGLAHATGDVIAYLDSDNRWVGWFLEVMVRHLTATGLDAAYSGIALRDDGGRLTGYRGDDFDRAACLEQNYVDLNAFCHRRALLDRVGHFDERLRRMVDWDLILRIAAAGPVGYAPFVGCDYADGKADAGRITVTEPLAFRKVVALKNAATADGGPLDLADPAFADRLKLTFAIKIAAPREERAAWGDWHFAESLGAALARLGHTAHVDCRGEWARRTLADEDVAIVLRGLLPYTPRPGQLACLWNISHPDQVPFEEYDAFARVYVASVSHAALLGPLVRPPVTPLLQATDVTRFHPVADAPSGPPVLFVGNSRGVDRAIVRWAIEAGHPPTIVGGGWEGRVPPGLVAAETIDNEDLGALYASAGVVLNDHWPSMRAFGYLSNRLFDVVAAGGRAISDSVPSMAQLFGDAVAQVDGPATLATAIQAYSDTGVNGLHARSQESSSEPSPPFRGEGRERGSSSSSTGKEEEVPSPNPLPRSGERANFIARHHSFDARATRIATDMLAHLGVAPAEPARREEFSSGTLSPFRGEGRAEPPKVPTMRSIGGKAAEGRGLLLRPAGQEEDPSPNPLPRSGERDKTATPPLRIHILTPHGPHGPQSSATIRLLAPLTDETVSGRAALTIGRAEDVPPPCDICIVQRTALPTPAAADALKAHLDAAGAILVTDIDDAFRAIGPDHPEHARYAPLSAALDRAVALSAERWFSTPTLAALYADIAPDPVILPNAIDPRLWRDWRHPRPAAFANVEETGRVRMLYMGSATHGRDLAAIRPALERLAAERPGRFDLTLIGVAADVPSAPWLGRLSPPAGAISYARFVRWLRAQGPFDVGLAPLADSAFNRAKSDIKFLDYAALGLLPLLSDGPVYRHDPAVAHLAHLAGPDDWHATLAAILDDPAAARARAAAAHAHVWAHRTVAGIAATLLARLEALARRTPPR